VADGHAVLVSDVVEGLKLFIVEELLLDLSVDGSDFCIEFLFLAGEFVEFATHFKDVLLDFRVLLPSDPLYGILLQLFDIIDPLQDVGDVVNPPLLDAQLIHSHVQVDRAVLTLFNQLDELLGENRETVVLPSPPYLAIKVLLGVTSSSS
jgi:hypothetical protein